MRDFIDIIRETIEPTFQIEVDGFHSGQMDASVVALIAGSAVGFLRFTEYQGKPSIRMVEVDPKFQRKGIARGMLHKLQAEYPNEEIDWGSLTDDGAELYAKMNFRDEAVPEVVEKIERLKALRAQDDLWRALADRATALGDPHDLKQLHAVVERWNDLTDEIYRLEQELHGAKASKRFIQASPTSAV